MNRAIKKLVERATVLSGIPRAARAARRQSAVILTYHDVVASRSRQVGDHSLHIRRGDFARHLDFLGEACDVVPLRSLVSGETKPGGRLRVAITFDDAYESALAIGLEEVVKRRMPATVFVPPGLLGRETWWDIVAAGAGGEISDEMRRVCLEQFEGRSDAILESSGSQRIDPRNEREVPRIAREEELWSAVRRSGITVGSHSWSHPNLAAVDEGALEQELRRSFEWLAERCESFVPFVSYPYGLWSERVADAARDAGFDAGFRADGGWLPANPSQHRFKLPRFNVPAGLSVDGLRLRLAGIGLA